MNILDISFVNNSSDTTLIGMLVKEKVLALLCGDQEEDHPKLIRNVGELRKGIKSLAIDFLEGGRKKVSQVTFREINKVIDVVQKLKSAVHNKCFGYKPKFVCTQI